jgi:hypothetical protein
LYQKNIFALKIGKVNYFTSFTAPHNTMDFGFTIETTREEEIICKPPVREKIDEPIGYGYDPVVPIIRFRPLP